MSYKDICFKYKQKYDVDITFAIQRFNDIGQVIYDQQCLKNMHQVLVKLSDGFYIKFIRREALNLDVPVFLLQQTIFGGEISNYISVTQSEKVIARAVLSYLPDKQILTVKCYDQNRCSVFPQDFAFMRNDSDSFRISEPFFDLQKNGIPASGYFKVQVFHGRIAVISNSIYLKAGQGEVKIESDLVEDRPQARLSGLPGANSNISQKLLRDKLRKQQPEKIAPKAIPKKANVLKKEPELEPVPFTQIYKKYTNTEGEAFEMQVNFNFDAQNPRFFVVNQLMNLDYLVSQTKVEYKQNKRQFDIFITFGTCDIAQIPNLLIEVGEEQFFIPLTYQPIKPGPEHRDNWDLVERGEFEAPIQMIGVTDASVLLGTFLNDGNKAILIDEKDAFILEYTRQQFEVIHPASLFVVVPEHATTACSLKQFGAVQEFSRNLTLGEFDFFTDVFWDEIYKNDKDGVVFRETSHNLLLKIRTKIFIINCGAEEDRDFIYLSMLRYRGLTFGPDELNSSNRKFIEEQLTNFGEYHPRPHQLVTCDKKVALGQPLQAKYESDAYVTVVATTNCGIFESVPLDWCGKLRNNFMFRQLEVWASCRYGSQKMIVCKKLVPLNMCEVLERVQNLETAKKIFAISLIDDYGKKNTVEMKIHKGLVTMKTKKSDLFTFESELRDIRTIFNAVNAFSMLWENQIYDIECEEKDYAELYTIFTE